MKPAWARALPMPWLYRGVLFVVWCWFKLLYRHKVYGLEHVYEGSAIIAGNHTSFYDPPILAISWPKEVHFLAREGLFKNRLFGGLIRRLNSHPVSGDAGDVVVFRTICQLLNEGKQIILFPEGSRAWNNALGSLKPGISLLVSRSKAAIIPAYIHGAYDIWNRKRKFPKLYGRTACVFGTPIVWEEFAHIDRKLVQARLSERLVEAISSLRQWYESGARGTPP